MAASLGGLGLLQGRVRLAAAAAAASSLSRPGPQGLVRGGAACSPTGRGYSSEAKGEEELRVRYLDEENQGNGSPGRGGGCSAENCGPGVQLPITARWTVQGEPRDWCHPPPPFAWCISAIRRRPVVSPARRSAVISRQLMDGAGPLNAWR